MNTKNVVKRLAAVATGAAMLGATVMGAFAADLNNYPDMFVADGTFDGYFVVGEAAASVDNLAMTDIATNMWYMAAGEGATTTTTVEGDAWLAATSSNFLELGENVTSIESYADDASLGALADGEISNSKGTAEYEQFLYFDQNDATVTFQEDDDDNVGYFYKIGSGDEIARYVLDFTTSLESDIDSNSDYDDLEDEKITILGKEFTITTATNTTSGPQLILMGGAASDTINEGETKTYTVGGQEYEVELLSVTSTEAQFSINGETTSKLEDSETDVLDDGVTNIGVTDITYQEYAGGIHSASFFLGADKLDLKHGSDLKVNEETIGEAAVSFDFDESGGDIQIDEITITMTAEDDLYVPVGGKLSEAVDLDEPEVLFTQNWDMELAGVDIGSGESVALTWSESDEQADLAVSLYDGDASLSLVYGGSGTTVNAGEDSDDTFVLNASASISDEDFFFVSTEDPSSSGNDAKSYLLQYKSADALEDDNPKATVKNLASGETYERSLTNSSGDARFDIKLGGTTFVFNSVTNPGDSDDDYAIQLVSGGSAGVSGTGEAVSVSFRTADNNLITVTDNNATSGTAGDSSSWTLTAAVDDTDKMDDTDVASYTALNVNITAASDELAVSAGTVAAGSGITDPDDSDITYFYDNYGNQLTVTDADSSPSKYELVMPENQAEVSLYVTSGAVSSSTTSSGDGTLTQVRVVDATKLDSEVSSVSAQNLIVVGGPCVNSVAAELAGNPSNCAEGYSAGVSKVELFENGDSVAMLVAGYSGADTRLAGQVIAHRYSELSGEAVEIEGTTYSSASIGAPSAPAVAAEEPAAEEMAEEADADAEASQE